jgi:hypothetical protein
MRIFGTKNWKMTRPIAKLEHVIDTLDHQEPVQCK